MSDERPERVTVQVILERERFFNRRMARYFRIDLINTAIYLTFTIIMVVTGNTGWPFVITNVAVLLFLVTTIWRATISYRMGYQDGLAAYPLALSQPTVNDAAYLLEHSDELWKPTPTEVAHSMDIERLEREANGG